MLSQFQIERAAGIDSEDIAQHIMTEATPAAKNAMSLLKMCIARFEEGAFGLLKSAVSECKREIAR